MVMGLMLLAFMVPATAQSSTRTHSVTITNLTDSQPFTPPLLTTHRASVQLFNGFQPASDGLVLHRSPGHDLPTDDALVCRRSCVV